MNNHCLNDLPQIPNHRYQPVTYFVLTILITWVSLFIAAYCSHTPGLERFMLPVMIPSLLSPLAIALWLIKTQGNKELKKDFKKRLTLFNSVTQSYWAVIFLLLPVVVLLATSVSLLVGQSVQQFSFSEEFTVLSGQVAVSIAIMFLAPAFEELGWRGYGMDSLLYGRNLLAASLVFTILWGLWHVPLFFIKGYYHYEILHLNSLYALNFFVALLPATILSNWIFYKTNRSIPAIILFHFMLNLSMVLLQTEQDTKIISTMLLLLISLGVIIKNKGLFFVRIPMVHTNHSIK